MKDWLDLEMEREGYTRHRSQAAMLREEHLAFCEAKELSMFDRMNSDAKRLKKEHEKAHAAINHQKPKRKPSSNSMLDTWLKLK